MDSDKPHEIPTELVENDARSRSRGSIIRKVLYAVGLVGVVLSALYLAPSGPFDDGEACGLSLLHMFVAILCLSIILLNSSGPNVAANHGGIGLLVGLFISFIFNASLKAGMIFFLFGAFPGAIFGVLIGIVRRSMAAAHLAAANGTAAERAEHRDEDNGRRGCRSAVIVVAITLFIGSLPFLLVIGWIELMSLRIDATRHMLLKVIDHVAVRDAGRTLLSQYPRDSRITESQLPPELRELGPQWDYIDPRGWLSLEFGGGFHHHGLLISPLSEESTVSDNKHRAYTPLADGIWYYEDKN